MGSGGWGGIQGLGWDHRAAGCPSCLEAKGCVDEEEFVQILWIVRLAGLVGAGRDGMGQGGMGWDMMGWGGTGWDGTGWDGMGRGGPVRE